MLSIGVRQLKEQTSQILRRVREDGETVEITYHGETIARLVPVTRQEQLDQEEIDAVWTDLDRLAAEIGEHWSDDVSAAEAVREGRRDL
jgi:prevent-host-death family protein